MTGDEEIRLLREIARWTREAALPSARARVERLVDSDTKKRVYEAMAEGTSSITAIEKHTGVNHADIGTWVRDWQAEGIVDPNASPPMALFTLRELGIDSPPPRPVRAKKAKK